MNIKLDHISIYCFDLDKSVAFYKNVLELESKPRPSFNFPGHWFNIGNGLELHLISGRNVDKNTLPTTRNIHYAFKVENALEFNKKIDQLGLPKIGPKYRPDGVIQIFIQDPDGYWIEVTE